MYSVLIFLNDSTVLCGASEKNIRNPAVVYVATKSNDISTGHRF